MYKIFISGSKFFGESTLRLALDKGLDVVGVSAPAGEVEDRLYNASVALGIPVRRAGKSLGADAIPDGTDLIVCAYSHEFVTTPALEKAVYGGVGYHPSLLPDLRGKNAVEEAVKRGYSKTGGTIYVLDNGWDTGRVLMSEELNVDAGETAEHLWRDGLQPLGLRLYTKFFDELTLYGPVWDARYVRAYSVYGDDRDW